ncbi:hypothetical protein [Aeromonas veronii]|uniref:hypothetical protein n=1 Tax=Aeromonas veronii TaxID=654 RepID=UPI003D1AE11A
MSTEEKIIFHLKDTASTLKKSDAHDFIAIGGIALHCHLRNRELPSIKHTKDADVMCGFTSFSILRSIFEVTYNARLSKYEYKVKKHDGSNEFDVDLYLERNHALSIDFDSLNATKINNAADGFYTASLIHLLKLKVDNHANFVGSHTCEKYSKIICDIIQLIALIKADNTSTEQIENNIDSVRLAKIRSIIDGNKSVIDLIDSSFKEIECVNNGFIVLSRASSQDMSNA